jgi:Winged helix-turn-helix DNA-binding
MQWQTITEPRAVSLILQLERRRCLDLLMQQNLTVSQLAAALNINLQAAHYQVRRLERLGLIQVAQLEPRRGRAIKHYHASSNGFFVPFYATPAVTLEGFVQQVMVETQTVFNHFLTQAGTSLVKDPARTGLRLYLHDGNVIADISADGEHFDTLQAMLEPDAPAMMSSFMLFQLSHENAKKLQREMLELLLRYQQPSGAESYFAHVGLVPTDSV